jgi:hypothetical protein
MASMAIYTNHKVYVGRNGVNPMMVPMSLAEFPIFQPPWLFGFPSHDFSISSLVGKT